MDINSLWTIGEFDHSSKKLIPVTFELHHSYGKNGGHTEWYKKTGNGKFFTVITNFKQVLSVSDDLKFHAKRYAPLPEGHVFMIERLEEALKL